MKRKKSIPAETRRKRRQMWRIWPVWARQKWLPGSEVVAENLMVVAGNLSIPAVSKLNARQKHHPRLPLPSVYRNPGNLSLPLTLSLSLMLFTNPFA
jgi:hypothetical protein